MKKNERIKQNEELLKKYPFLCMKNAYGKNIFAEGENECTALDMMLSGWRKAFGQQFCDDFLVAWECLSDEYKGFFYFTEIKEKYGELRFYTTIYTEKIHQVVTKYEQLSKKYCIKCGARCVQNSWMD